MLTITRNRRRMISSLLERALQPSEYYWFDLYHRPTVRRQMAREEERHRLNPAIAFSLMAMGIRRRTSDETTTYGYGSGNVTLIPSEVLPPPRGSQDLSERLKDEAEKYLNQAILSADKATGSWLQIAQAATILMQLEMEVSPSYLRYLYLAAIFFRAPSLQIALDQEARTSIGVRFQNGPLMKAPNEIKRSSITMEAAARLRLLPLWVGSRVGVAFPNIEFHQTHFKEVDVQEAYSFAPWPDDQVLTDDSKDAYAYSLRARIIGLSILSTALGARFMPYGLNYAEPTDLLSKCLRILDDSEFVLDLSREVIDLHENSYYRLSMVRLVTSVCHMHGIVIRRCNLAHCDALRSTVVSRLRGEMQAKDEAGVRPRQRKFASVALELWVEIMEVYVTELDTDHLTYTTSGGIEAGVRLHVSRYQIDVLRLYVAATYQVRGGVINTLRLVGVQSPNNDDLVQQMTDVAERLQERIVRHTKLLEDCEQRLFGHNFTTYNNDVPVAHPLADYRPISVSIEAPSTDLAPYRISRNG